MAKLFKQLIGGKKVSDAKTSGSVQELRSKSPPKNSNRCSVLCVPSVDVVTLASDGRRHSDAVNVQSLRRPNKLPSSSQRLIGVSRGKVKHSCKETSHHLGHSENKLVNDCRCRHIINKCSPVETKNIDAVSPKILDVYSDPVDLKKESVEDDDEPTTSGLAEDDYSLPYDTKENIQSAVASATSAAAAAAAVLDAGSQARECTDVKECGSPSKISVGRSSTECSKESSAMLQDDDNDDDHEGKLTGTEDPVEGNHPVISAVTGEATYDEPWDLFATRQDLEGQLKAMHKDGLDKLPTSAEWTKQRQWSVDGIVSPLNDSRPSMEYDEPWDRRKTELAKSFVKVEIDSEAARTLQAQHCYSASETGCKSSSSSSAIMNGKSTTDVSDSYQEVETGPTGPWKPRKSADAKTAAKMTKYCSLNHRSSSRRNCDQHTLVCRTPWQHHPCQIDPKLPLEEQRWYHGTISRMDAESLLRVHREGSYLVRTSESNRLDYSLSLKSTHGFMHMKIVREEDKFVLGQFSQPFDSIPQMIFFFTVNKVPIRGTDHMFLAYPIRHDELL